MPNAAACHIICKQKAGLTFLDMLTGAKSPRRDVYKKCMAGFGHTGGKKSRRGRSRSRDNRKTRRNQ